MSRLSRLINAFRPDRLDGRTRRGACAFIWRRARRKPSAAAGVQHEAARAARPRLGNELHTRESSRDARLTPWLESLLKDARFGSRMLRKDSAVTAWPRWRRWRWRSAPQLAAFALVDALLLRPLPVYQPERLVQLTTRDEREEARKRQLSTIPSSSGAARPRAGNWICSA
jgi:putative ABC transport system permease protein